MFLCAHSLYCSSVRTRLKTSYIISARHCAWVLVHVITKAAVMAGGGGSHYIWPRHCWNNNNNLPELQYIRVYTYMRVYVSVCIYIGPLSVYIYIYIYTHLVNDATTNIYAHNTLMVIKRVGETTRVMAEGSPSTAASVLSSTFKGRAT